MSPTTRRQLQLVMAIVLGSVAVSVAMGQQAPGANQSLAGRQTSGVTAEVSPLSHASLAGNAGGWSQPAIRRAVSTKPGPANHGRRVENRGRDGYPISSLQYDTKTSSI